jgi:hypothetical protein
MIVSVPIATYAEGLPLHIAIEDKSGNSAVLEFHQWKNGGARGAPSSRAMCRRISSQQRRRSRIETGDGAAVWELHGNSTEVHSARFFPRSLAYGVSAEAVIPSV